MSTQPIAINHIELRLNRDGQPRAYVVGTRVRVQDIVADHERHGLSPELIAREYPHLTLAQVHAALAYYFDHREEVRGQMQADEEFAERIQAQSQAGTARRSKGREGHGGSVSS